MDYAVIETNGWKASSQFAFLITYSTFKRVGRFEHVLSSFYFFFYFNLAKYIQKRDKDKQALFCWSLRFEIQQIPIRAKFVDTPII